MSPFYNMNPTYQTHMVVTNGFQRAGELSKGVEHNSCACCCCCCTWEITKHRDRDWCVPQLLKVSCLSTNITHFIHVTCWICCTQHVCCVLSNWKSRTGKKILLLTVQWLLGHQHRPNKHRANMTWWPQNNVSILRQEKKKKYPHWPKTWQWLSQYQ